MPKRSVPVLAAAVICAAAGMAEAATVRREPFGALPDDTPVEAVVLTGGDGGRGRDHNLVLDQGATAIPEPAMRLEDAESEVPTTEPGLQFQLGNVLDGTPIGKGGHVYRLGDGLSFAPERLPDTPNEPAFGSARSRQTLPSPHDLSRVRRTLRSSPS